MFSLKFGLGSFCRKTGFFSGTSNFGSTYAFSFRSFFRTASFSFSSFLFRSTGFFRSYALTLRFFAG